MTTYEKMKEALEHVKKLAREFECGNYYLSDLPKMLMDAVEHALDTPPRNCDVISTDEQYPRFFTFCLNHRHDDCDDCPLRRYALTGCELAWAQLPYQEHEGK